MPVCLPGMPVGHLLCLDPNKHLRLPSPSNPCRQMCLRVAGNKQIDFSFLFSSSRGGHVLLSPLKWPLQTTRLYYLNFFYFFASSFSFATGNPKGPESLGVFLYISWLLLSLPLLERTKSEKRRQTDRSLKFGRFSQMLVKRKSHLTMSCFP